jgi:hypothetical protein
LEAILESHRLNRDDVEDGMKDWGVVKNTEIISSQARSLETGDVGET